MTTIITIDIQTLLETSMEVLPDNGEVVMRWTGMEKMEYSPSHYPICDGWGSDTAQLVTELPEISWQEEIQKLQGIRIQCASFEEDKNSGTMASRPIDKNNADNFSGKSNPLEQAIYKNK